MGKAIIDAFLCVLLERAKLLFWSLHIGAIRTHRVQPPFLVGLPLYYTHVRTSPERTLKSNA
jgi:hypothetical protein